MTTLSNTEPKIDLKSKTLQEQKTIQQVNIRANTISNQLELPSDSSKTKMKIIDLAQELDVSVKDLQNDCNKLNIELSKANLLNDSDVQKIREYRNTHANDKIEQRETKSGVIIIRHQADN